MKTMRRFLAVLVSAMMLFAMVPISAPAEGGEMLLMLVPAEETAPTPESPQEPTQAPIQPTQAPPLVINLQTLPPETQKPAPESAAPTTKPTEKPAPTATATVAPTLEPTAEPTQAPEYAFRQMMPMSFGDAGIFALEGGIETSITITPNQSATLIYKDTNNSLTIDAAFSYTDDGVTDPPTGTLTCTLDRQPFASGLGLGFAGHTLSLAGLSAGPHTVTVSYDGDGVYAASTADYTFTIAQATTSATLSVQPGTVAAGENVQLMAAVTDQFTNSVTEGVVKYYRTTPTRTLVGSAAPNQTINISAPADEGIDYGYAAEYEDAAGNYAASSATGTLTVTTTAAGTTATLSGTTPQTYGNAFDLSFAVSAESGTPTGTAQLYLGMGSANPIGSAITLSDGTCTFNVPATLATTPVGDQVYRAVYIPTDITYAGSSATTTVTIAKRPIAVSLNATQSSIAFGQTGTVTLNASVSDETDNTGYPVSSGIMTIYQVVGGQEIFLATGNSCELPAGLAIGTHTFIARYVSEDLIHADGASAIFSVEVTKAAPGTPVLTADPTTVAYGQQDSVSLSVSLTGLSGASITDGTIEYRLDDAKLTGSAIEYGATDFTATLTVPADLDTGSHTLTAKFMGNDTYTESAISNTATLTVEATALSVTLSVGEVAVPGEGGSGYGLQAAVLDTSDDSPIEGATVFFYLDGVKIGEGTTNTEGKAFYTHILATPLTAGAHSFFAEYQTDGTIPTTRSVPVSVYVKADTKTTMTITPENVAHGETAQFTLSATVTESDGSTPVTGGEVYFYFGMNRILATEDTTLGADGTVTVSYTTAALTEQTPFHAEYVGNDTHNGSSSGEVNYQLKAASQTTLYIWPETSGSQSTTVFGLIADVEEKNATSGSAIPTGAVWFYLDGIRIDSGDISLDADGSAEFTYTATGLTVGEHTFTAMYQGSDALAPSTSAGVKHTVIDGINSETILTVTPATCAYGTLGQITLTATVHDELGNPATGKVSFYQVTKLFEDVALDENGSASQYLQVQAGAQPSPNTYYFSAEYLGADGIAASSDIGTMIITKATTATALTVTPTSVSTGTAQTITLQAKVTEEATGDHNPVGTGTVSFTLNGTALTDLDVKYDTSKKAFIASYTLPANAAVGNYQFSATYGGTSNYLSSTGAATLQVTKGMVTPTVTLIASPNPVTQGSTLELSVTVAAAGQTIAPSGKVQFYDGITKLGTEMALTGGKVTVQITTLTVGTHSITVKYLGDSLYNEATSAAMSVTVQSKGDSTPPKSISAAQGSKLKDVPLPTGWTWDYPETVLNTLGMWPYYATYTDSAGVKTSGIAIMVNVTASSTDGSKSGGSSGSGSSGSGGSSGGSSGSSSDIAAYDWSNAEEITAWDANGRLVASFTLDDQVISEGVMRIIIEEDLDALVWRIPLDQLHVLYDRSPSALLLLEMPSTSVPLPVSLLEDEIELEDGSTLRMWTFEGILELTLARFPEEQSLPEGAVRMGEFAMMMRLLDVNGIEVQLLDPEELL